MIDKLLELFKSFDKAYGKYIISSALPDSDSGKVSGKAYTCREEVNTLLWKELWSKHISGKQALGIAPILADSLCYWGAIDIDDYKADNNKIINKIKEFELPLVPILSKSGGLHIYIFFEKACTAKELRNLLKQYSAALGFGGSEIFPKQTTLCIDKGDCPNWINAPYFNVTNTNRYAIDFNLRKLSLEEFIAFAFAKRLKTIKEAKEIIYKTEEYLNGCPPCLSNILSRGKIDSMRDEHLFNIGIFLKRKFSSDWENLMSKVNMDYCSPPISNSELQNAIIKPLNKKDYNYKCSTSFMKEHCSVAKCLESQFGIESDNEIVLTGLTKYATIPPIWFIEIENYGRVQVSTEALQSQFLFQKVCMEQINKVIPLVKPVVWADKIKTLFDNINIIDMPEDVTPRGNFLRLLDKYLNYYAQGKDMSEILLGKPFFQDNTYYFSLTEGLEKFLNKQNFTTKEFSRGNIATTLRDIGGTTSKVRVLIKDKPRQIRVWQVPEDAIESLPHCKPENPEDVF